MGKLTTENLFVVIMGVSTVFIGLICIILLCKIIGLLCKSSDKNTTAANAATVAPAPAPAASPVQPIQNKQEIIAAVSAVIAEELGTDISAIRILSFKKI